VLLFHCIDHDDSFRTTGNGCHEGRDSLLDFVHAYRSDGVADLTLQNRRDMGLFDRIAGVMGKPRLLERNPTNEQSST
jgi:hypothetical protein